MPTSSAPPVESTSTVFVIQQPRPKTGEKWVPNLQPATQFGKLEFIFEASDRIYADPTEGRKKAAARLADFDSDRDYLLWTNFGDPAALWLVIMLLTLGGHKRLRFLYWSRGRATTGGMSTENGFYFPVDLDFRSR